MIYVIERNSYNHRTNEVATNYEIINDNKIIKIRRLLTDDQIANLKTYGNTCLAYDIYKQLDEDTIINEVEKLTGSKCKLSFYNHTYDKPSVIISLTKKWYFTYRRPANFS